MAKLAWNSPYIVQNKCAWKRHLPTELSSICDTHATHANYLHRFPVALDSSSIFLRENGKSVRSGRVTLPHPGFIGTAAKELMVGTPVPFHWKPLQYRRCVLDLGESLQRFFNFEMRERYCQPQRHDIRIAF